MLPHQHSSMRLYLAIPFLYAALFVSAVAQSSSSSSPGSPVQESTESTVHPGTGLAEAGGASITLETSEPLFDIASALNVCGYDTDLASSNPIRSEVRADVAQTIASSPEAATSRKAICAYIAEHELNDKGRQLAQYISLALYLTPPPSLTTIADQSEMPPDALNVVNILPQLRTFVEATRLHAIWLKHRAQYEAITAALHQPVTELVFGTNVYLKLPVSSYSNRRLLILVEPMLAPSAPNARIYATDNIVVTSPTVSGAVRMDQIRHLYLHYTIEPLIYARTSSMMRLTPLLKPVADAPLEYTYKTDVVALTTECLIKAIEARRLETGLTPPLKPKDVRVRAELARYDEELASYERQSEDMRRAQVTLDMRQGWTLTAYFYDELVKLERNPEGLGESIGLMVYGMDVDRERRPRRDDRLPPSRLRRVRPPSPESAIRHDAC